MLKNNLLIALRTLRKEKGYAMINVFGLAIGLACCMMITLYVHDEVRYDRFHEDADRIFRVNRVYTVPDQVSQYANVASAVGPTMAATFPAVEAYTRLMLPMPREIVLSRDDERYYETGLYWADASVFDVFDFPLLRGDSQTALAEPFTVVLTEELARKYFGDADPMGQTIRIHSWIPHDYRVTGILAPVPTQSHLQFSVLASIAGEESRYTSLFAGEGQWTNSLFYTYVRLTTPEAANDLNDALPAFADLHLGEFARSRGFEPNFALMPLTDIHLRSEQNVEVANASDIRYVYLFSAIALFVLLLACANFMNLATARSAKRATEVGLRKVLGAAQGQLVWRFLGEALVLAGMGLLLAGLLVELALPVLNTFTGKSLTLVNADPVLLLAFLGIGLLAGLLAGSYPAFYISSFQPARVLKGVDRTGRGAGSLRKGLVVFQFGVSILLIAATLMVYRQLQYMADKDLGFDDEQIVVLPLRFDPDEQDIEIVKRDLMQHPDVIGVSAAAGVPGIRGLIDGWPVVPEGRSIQEQIPVTIAGVDTDYLDVLGLELLEGRFFSQDYSTDATEAFVINETAARTFGWTEPVGKRLTTNMDDGRTGTVVGVVKDFHLESLHHPVEPVVMQIWPNRFQVLAVKTRATGLDATLEFLKQRWTVYTPEEPFRYSFLDADFGRQYLSEQRVARLFGVFTGLALLVACLGLFGLAAFSAQQRTKEIGIRKVLGASVGGLVVLLSKDFARLVVIALVIAAPLAYVGLRWWLQDFAYRAPLSLDVFLMAGAFALIVALVTVSVQALRAARANPIHSLRYE